MILHDRLRDLYEAALRVNKFPKTFDVIDTIYDSTHESFVHASRYVYLEGTMNGERILKLFYYHVDDRGFMYEYEIKDRVLKQTDIDLVNRDTHFTKYELKDYKIKTNISESVRTGSN